MNDFQKAADEYLEKYRLKLKDAEYRTLHIIELRSKIENATGHIDDAAGFTGYFVGTCKITGKTIRTTDKNLLKNPKPEWAQGITHGTGKKNTGGKEALLAILIDEQAKRDDLLREALELHDKIDARINKVLGDLPEAQILKYRGLHGLGNEKVAEQLNYSKWHASRLYYNGLELLGRDLKKTATERKE